MGYWFCKNIFDVVATGTLCKSCLLAATTLQRHPLCSAYVKYCQKQMNKHGPMQCLKKEVGSRAHFNRFVVKMKAARDTSSWLCVCLLP